MADESSPPLSSELLGDVVISVDTAMAEATQLRELVEETVLRLLIHGILHLLGYDHERSPGEAARMTREQNRLLALLRRSENESPRAHRAHTIRGTTNGSTGCQC